jgi:Fe-S oxidoreductase
VAALADGGVIDPDVLWSCTNCGACVEQCPVDIEHIDHIEDMRRYQVLIESSFPSEAGTMMRNLENNGNPWGVSPRSRTEWYADLAFEVRTVEPGQALPDDVEYLYWVGCAGAIEDRSRRTTRAFAELLHTADVSFAVLGAAETCSGDPARRMGNEYLFQTLARQNIETLNGIGATKIVMTCPHCFNSLGREYPALGGTYEVVHHTQLLARLVSERRLVPVTPVEGTVTYHDPCFLGRHNRVYSPPREVLESISGLRNQEMHRCKERGFCCGAGGARMWMEERIGKKINVERADEALGLDPDMVSTACPFCMVMLSDAVTAKQQAGQAREGVEVLDVAQILARSLVAPSGTVVEDPTPAVAPEPSASTATVEAPPPGDLPPG